jgi:hypothetical protein
MYEWVANGRQSIGDSRAITIDSPPWPFGALGNNAPGAVAY